MRRFVIGDIHGRADAFRELLKRVGFDYDTDKLIVLGDVVDGGEDVKGAVEELLKIKNLVYVLGNHDWWFMRYVVEGEVSDAWYCQGGDATLESYQEGIPDAHKALFFYEAKVLHEEDGMVFAHGGIKPGVALEENDVEFVIWDRDLPEAFMNGAAFPHKKIFIGHTPTTIYGSTVPVIRESNGTELIMMDTGAGWRGRLTIMDVDTEEFWQSEELSPSSRYEAGGLF